MRLEWRLLYWLAALLAVVSLAGTASAYLLQMRLQDRDDAFLSGLLSQAWQRASFRAEVEFQAMQKDGLSTALALAVCAPDLHTVLDRWSSAHPGWRLELADGSGNLLYTNATAVDAPSLVAGRDRIGSMEAEIDIRRSVSAAGHAVTSSFTQRPSIYFDVLGPGAYAWVSQRQIGPPQLSPSVSPLSLAAMTKVTTATTATTAPFEDCRNSSARVVLIGRDVGPALAAISLGLGGRVVMQALALPAVQAPPVMRITRGEGVVQQVSLLIVGADARPLASLLWQPEQAGAQDERSETDLLQGLAKRRTGGGADGLQSSDHSRWIRAVVVCSGIAASLGLLCLLFMLLRWGIRQFFAPLRRSMHAFNSLLAGDYVLNLDDEDSEQRDEAGQMARGVSQMRSDLLNLRMLQEERQRSAQQQGRLIREPLLNLARGLDDSDREDIGAWLDRLDWQGQQSRSPLADLAGVLDRLTTLVSAQHQKRLLALRDLALASQRDAQFAALQQELDIARQMQLSILPTNLPGWHGLNLAAKIIPAKEVGGDFYDYFLLDDRHLALVIADVSGKGVPAAFFMAIARSLLKSMADRTIDPAQTITRLNDLLCEDNPQWMFVTLFYGVLELDSGIFQYVNAGHNPPLIAASRVLASSSGPSQPASPHSATSPLPSPVWAERIRKLASGRNPALGVVEGHAYRGDMTRLNDGDVLFLYTDGFSEAQNPAQALFGDAALVAALCEVLFDGVQHASTTMTVPDAATINDGMIAVVRAFENGAAQADDMTCLALCYTSPSLTLDSVTHAPAAQERE